jgi:hypothetical protein
MKCTIKRPQEVNVKTLVAYLGTIVEEIETYYNEIKIGNQTFNSYEELFNTYPSICAFFDRDTIVLHIDIDTGKVLNWPDELGSYDFNDFKIVDTGYYKLLDDKGDEIVSYEGYVPNCIGEWGDYLNFEIEDGYIVGWEFTEDDVTSILSEADYD